MKGWIFLVGKDWKLIFRNRLLLVVLIIYPFLIMGVIGAAFYDTGRPVPLGVVNLDSVEAGRLAWVGAPLVGGWADARNILGKSAEVKTYESGEEALSELRAGTVSLVAVAAGPAGERQWLGKKFSHDTIEQLLTQISPTPTDYSSEEDALKSLDEGTNNLLLALGEEDYPFIAETVWLDGQSYDSSSLLEKFAADVTEIVEYPTEDFAHEALQKGRVDAIIVLPRGFVHDLKTLDKIAFINVSLDQSNMVKAEFAETNIRGFLARINEGVVKSKMAAVITGLYSLVGGGDFFGTQITGLGQIRDNLEKIKAALTGNAELQASVDTGIDLADTVINDIEDAMAYLKGTALPIQLDITSVAGRPLSTKDAVVPSLIVLSILWTGVLCGAILMVSDEEEGMSQRLRLTEAGPLAIPSSKVFLASAIVFVQSITMLIIAVAILGAFASHIPLALLVIAAACFSCIGIGLLIAAFARQVAGAVILSVLVTFPLIFMTGAVFPLSQMPVFMQWLARAVPVTYAIEALSGVMLRAETIADVGWEIGVLLAFGVVLIGLAAALLRRRTA
jgi:ABC-type multidrug transport system permease subunit